MRVFRQFFSLACLLLMLSLFACGEPVRKVKRIEPASPRTSTPIEKVLNSVVKIDSVVRQHSDGMAILQRGTGAGVVISSNGEVITNYHVVANAVRIRATLYDRREVEAQIVGLDPWTDLALLKLDVKNGLPFVNFSSSSFLVHGQTVYAVGSPRRLRHTVNKGIVSSTRRFLGTEFYFPDGMKTGAFTAWIQTDALVEPGSSGGPLLNENGGVIGIITRSYSGGSGFAIPSDQALMVARELRDSGEVHRGWLGVRWSQSNDYCEALQLASPPTGPVVAEIDRDSPFYEKLLPGDIVVKLNGAIIEGRYDEDLPEVRAIISQLTPGSTVTIEAWRPNKGNLRFAATVLEQSRAAGKMFECPAWGMTVRGITREMRIDFALPDEQGVYVTGVRNGGPAQKADIGGAYIIRTVNEEEIRDTNHFLEIYARSLEIGRALIVTTAGKFRMYHMLTFNKVENPAPPDETITEEEEK